MGTIGVQPEVWVCAMEAVERCGSAVQNDRLALTIDPQMKDLAARSLSERGGSGQINQAKAE